MHPWTSLCPPKHMPVPIRMYCTNMGAWMRFELIKHIYQNGASMDAPGMDVSIFMRLSRDASGWMHSAERHLDPSTQTRTCIFQFSYVVQIPSDNTLQQSVALDFTFWNLILFFFCIKCVVMRKQLHFGHTLKKQPKIWLFCEQNHKTHHKTTQKQKCGCFVNISFINQPKNNSKKLTLWNITPQVFINVKKSDCFVNVFLKKFFLKNPMMFFAAVYQNATWNRFQVLCMMNSSTNIKFDNYNVS